MCDNLIDGALIFTCALTKVAGVQKKITSSFRYHLHYPTSMKSRHLSKYHIQFLSTKNIKTIIFGSHEHFS